MLKVLVDSSVQFWVFLQNNENLKVNTENTGGRDVHGSTVVFPCTKLLGIFSHLWF